jgi:hypothetical protein
MEFGTTGHVPGSKEKNSKRREIICGHFIVMSNYKRKIGHSQCQPFSLLLSWLHLKNKWSDFSWE